MIINILNGIRVINKISILNGIRVINTFKEYKI